MAARYKVTWTLEAKVRVDHILNYLNEHWSDKEAQDFLDLLYHFERTVASFPRSFKESTRFKGCRLGYVHRHITAIYTISNSTVTILTVLDNRSERER